MAWPSERANGSVVPRDMERAWKSAPRAALAFLWTEMQTTRENYVNENAMNVKEKTQANPKNIDEANTNLHLMENNSCAVQASKLDS